LGRKVEFFRLGGVLQGLTALLISLHYLGGIASLGWMYGYLLLMPICGTVIFFSISIATAACAFWFGRVRDLQTLTYYAANYAASYPTSIYPVWLRGLLTLLPVSFIGYLPARFALGLGGSPWDLLLPWLAAVASLYLALRFWRVGEAAYHSSGS
jgi:ABC-2 type transport system permease protein